MWTGTPNMRYKETPPYKIILANKWKCSKELECHHLASSRCINASIITTERQGLLTSKKEWQPDTMCLPTEERTPGKVLQRDGIELVTPPNPAATYRKCREQRNYRIVPWLCRFPSNGKLCGPIIQILSQINCKEKKAVQRESVD